MGLEKYGPKAIGEEKYQEVQEELAKQVGTEESRFGVRGLLGSATLEEVRSAAEAADHDPDEWEERWRETHGDPSEGEGPDGEEETPQAAGEADSEPEPEGESEGNIVEMGDDEYNFPPGYDANHVGGGKYHVRTEEGEVVENPDHEKDLWPKVESKDVAWADYERRLDEAEEEAQQQEEESDGAALPGQAEQVSVERLEEILETEPTLIDERMQAEIFGREDGPRQEALKVMARSEIEGQGRESVKATLADAIDDIDFVEEVLV